MKLKRYNIFERDGFDDLDYYDDFHKKSKDYDYRSKDAGYNKLNYEDDYEDDNFEDDNFEDDMMNLTFLLKSMFKNSGIDIEVTNEEYDIEITVMLYNIENIDKLVNIFDIVKKLKNDILLGYASSFELWQNRNGYSIITFVFYMRDHNDLPF